MNYWDRPTLKQRAKAVLKTPGVYMTSVLVYVIFAVLGGVGGGGGSTASGSQDNSYSGGSGGGSAFSNFIESNLILALIVILVLIAIALAWSIFLSNPLTVGKNRYFLNIRSGPDKVGTLFWAFKDGKYMGMVKSMFAMSIRVFLWSLLLIVPGIIKSFEYFMVPYILAENPSIDKERALEISSRTTQGEKMNIFVLTLSFIGWFLLGALACGLGIFFVGPYQESTYAELFAALRYKAEKEGICQPGELGSEPVAPVSTPVQLPQ